MLHSIAVGNMLPSWVKIVCVDINPAVATKVSDRGTGQAVGVVTDVGLFLDLLARSLAVAGGEGRSAPTPTNTPPRASTRRCPRSRPGRTSIRRLRNRNRHARVHLASAREPACRTRAISILTLRSRQAVPGTEVAEDVHCSPIATSASSRRTSSTGFCGDIVKACRPIRATVTGDFTPRGGLSTRDHRELRPAPGVERTRER